MKNSKRYITYGIIITLLIIIVSNLAACSLFTMNVKADNLMEGISAKTVNGKATDERFIANTADFSIKLFKESVTKDKNSLISPFSVMLALSMTANGADNETLVQMQKVLGGDIKLEELNEYLYTYVKNLPSEEKSKLNIANSIWFRDGLTVEKDFLQKNADYYNAAAYKSAFDGQTLKDINNWTKQNTDGMIDKIIDSIDVDTVMYLINAIVFDAEWQKVYESKNINNGEFTTISGNKKNVEFMFSDENKYIKDENAKGFIKPYVKGKYSFAAILPDQNININDYVDSLTGEKFINLIKKSEVASVNAYLPKFSYDYKIIMNQALKEMGMPDAFDEDKADFNKIDKSQKDIFIGEVLHKTFISVDERGVKASVATKFNGEATACFEEKEVKEVKLDRPFVYAIIDNSTNFPVFIGTVNDIGK